MELITNAVLNSEETCVSTFLLLDTDKKVQMLDRLTRLAETDPYYELIKSDYDRPHRSSPESENDLLPKTEAALRKQVELLAQDGMTGGALEDASTKISALVSVLHELKN